MKHKIGILLTNLGTPDNPDPSSLRRYLAEFLSDKRVVEIPKPIWQIILYGVILPFRSKKSARLYQQIWQEEGSPLLINMKNLTNRLRDFFKYKELDNVVIELGMRYGNPSISSALEKLSQQNISQLIVLPLYPQYSAATVASTFDKVSDCLKKWRFIPEVKFIMGYAANNDYIDAVSQTISRYLAEHHPEKLLFSFHGIPQRSVELGDPYYQQCLQTADSIAKKLALPDDFWHVVFQSRFGRATWLQPYCAETLKNLPAENIKHIAIVSPGFSVDCLETLQELDIENRHLFIEAGGLTYDYIFCLNDSNAHVSMCYQLIKSSIQDVMSFDSVQ